MRFATRHRALRISGLIALLSFAAVNPSAFAAPVYWGQTNFSSDSTYEGTAATAENWFSDPAGTTVVPVAPDSPDEDLVFNTTPANAVGGSVRIDANFTANSFTFTTSGSTVLAQDANRNLVLGGGGITLNAPSGNVTFGINVNTLNVRLAASQTWTNHSASALNVRNVTTVAGAGPVVLSLNVAGSGLIILPLGVSDTLDDPLSVVIDSAGSGAVNIASGSYSGGTTINRGKLQTSGTKDTGEIVLGDTTGASDATLTVNSVSFPNTITARSGSSGSKSLVTTNAAGMMNGTITLDDTLSLVATGKLTTLHGVISGTGALVKSGKGGLTLAGNNTFSGHLTIQSGTLTLAEGGSLLFHLSDNGLTNQVSGSGDAAAIFHGTFTFKLPETALIDGASWPVVTVSKATYGPTFAITGFTRTGTDWTNGAGLTFSESAGVLSYQRNP